MITQEHYLNLIPNGVSTIVKASQYDKLSRTIVFNIYDGDELFTIPSDSSVTVLGTKQDKTGYQYQCEYNGSQVSFVIQEQMTVLCGKHQAEIRISKDGELIGTANFIFDVEKSALSDDTKISDTELPLIEKAVEAVDEVIVYANQAKQSADNAKTSEDNAKTSETNASQSANTATNKAGEASTSATNASASASSASQSAQSASDSATTATNKATEASNSARSASESATSASASANSASESAEYSSDEADRASDEADRAEKAMSTKMNLVSSPTSNNILITDDKGQAVDSKTKISDLKVKVLEVSSFSSLPQTISNSDITDTMVVINSVLSNPSAQTNDWTVTTNNGSLTISGSISGSTTLTLYLAEQR